MEYSIKYDQFIEIREDWFKSKKWVERSLCRIRERDEWKRREIEGTYSRTGE